MSVSMIILKGAFNIVRKIGALIVFGSVIHNQNQNNR